MSNWTRNGCDESFGIYYLTHKYLSSIMLAIFTTSKHVTVTEVDQFFCMQDEWCIFASSMPSFISISIPVAMKELKRSAYNDVTATVIGSRDQMCIHPDLKEMSNSEKVLECKHLRKRKKCEYHTNLVEQESILQEPEFMENIMDIEDLLRAGVKHACCPYFVAKARAERAQVIFMPYNVSGGRSYNFPQQFHWFSFHFILWAVSDRSVDSWRRFERYRNDWFNCDHGWGTWSLVNLIFGWFLFQNLVQHFHYI